MGAWAAREKWRDLQWWCSQHGHRTVPLEVGSYWASDWHEAKETIGTFAESFLRPSIACDNALRMRGAACASQSSAEQCADLKTIATHQASSKSAGSCKVAYLAQHRLLEQIPSLLEDIQEPSLWTKGYEVMNVWMGTRGTVRLSTHQYWLSYF
jgi:hypothetical protein